MQPWQPLLDLWFGDEADDVLRATRQAPLWWGKSSETDALLAKPIWRASRGRRQRGAWPTGADTAPAVRLALILLLDQLPRNIHRNTPAAFAQDPLARDLCLKGLSIGADKSLSPLERVFFYLPLEHAESREQQVQKCVPVRGTVCRAGWHTGAGDLCRICRLCPPPSGDHRTLWPLPPPQRHSGSHQHTGRGGIFAATGLRLLSKSYKKIPASWLAGIADG